MGDCQDMPILARSSPACLTSQAKSSKRRRGNQGPALASYRRGALADPEIPCSYAAGFAQEWVFAHQFMATENKTQQLHRKLGFPCYFPAISLVLLLETAWTATLLDSQKGVACKVPCSQGILDFEHTVICAGDLRCSVAE